MFSCQFFSSLLFSQHPIIFPASLFSKYGYHFSFHRSLMKEFTIISTPDLRCVSCYSPMYGERYMTSSSRLFTFKDISQIFPDTGFTILCFPRTISRTISFFLFHFQQGYKKPRVKSSNVACTLGRMQSPLLIIIFLCLKLTF